MPKMRSIGQSVQKLSSGNRHRYTDRHTERQKDRQTHGQTERQTCVKPLPTHFHGQ